MYNFLKVYFHFSSSQFSLLPSSPLLLLRSFLYRLNCLLKNFWKNLEEINKRKNSSYRPDIDGLRAIACFGVVIYHGFPDFLSGGFVGVDVFFVISGYLISTIIYSNLFNKSDPVHIFLIDFYVRRIKRIFPALCLVLVFCLIVGWFVLYPDEYKLLGKHIAAGSIYISNFILYNESGNYFDVETNFKPLIHLWSLGVEEQFYIVFPLLLLLVYKLHINFLLLLLFFTLTSYFLNVHGIANSNNQSLVFYMPWTRFWELSAGAVLAYVVLHPEYIKYITNLFNKRIKYILLYKPNSKNQILSNTVSLIGLFLILYAFYTFSHNDAFPGKNALFPVVGAILIIFSGKEVFLNKYILSCKFFVFLGLISYPLYLWHWPLLSFAYIYTGGTPSVLTRIVLVLISILFAFITYNFIEPHLRYGSFIKLKALCLLFLSFCIGFGGYSVFKNNGFLSRFYISNNLEIEQILNENYDTCLKKYPGWRSQDSRCFISNDDSDSVYIFGDSHAEHLVFGLQKLISEKNIKLGVNAFAGSCQIPFYNFVSGLKLSNSSLQNTENLLKMRQEASKLLDSAFVDSLENPHAKYYVLAHNPICSYFQGIQDKSNLNNSDTLSLYEVGARRTLDLLRKYNKQVIFILDNPSLPINPSGCRVRPFFFNKETCSFPRDFYDSNVAYRTYNNIIKNLAKEYDNVQYIDLSAYLCDKSNCYISISGLNLYRDDNHLNYDGSFFIAPFILHKILK